MFAAVLTTAAVASACGGSFTNGTRPGSDFATVKMAGPAPTAKDCQALCCKNGTSNGAGPKCVTWVFVPAGLYPKRPPGTFCWFKAVPLTLKGSTCDNGKPGCVSGVVNATLKTDDGASFSAAFSADLSPAGLLPFPHFWEECVGSSHMMLGTRADWRAHLKKVRDACGFKRIRGHGLLDNDMDIILSNTPAKCQGCTGSGDLSHASNLPPADIVPGAGWHFNWYGMDQVYDYLLSIGMKPVVALSWNNDQMSEHACAATWHYKGCGNYPSNLTRYAMMINSLARHLVDRHGVEEIRQWPFELWNGACSCSCSCSCFCRC